MALGRCATTMTMAPRARSPRMARVSDSSPSASRLELGSSEHDQERIAIKRARKRDALRLASGQGAAVFADIGFLAVRQIDDEVVNAGRLRGRGAQPRDGAASRSAQYSAPRCRGTIRRLAAGSRYAGRASPMTIGRAWRRRAECCRAPASIPPPTCVPATISPTRSGRSRQGLRLP